MRMLGAAGKIVRVTSSRPSLRPRLLGLILGLAAGNLAGCTSSLGGLNDIPPANVSTDHYEGMTCDQVRSMTHSLNAHKADLAPALFSSISEDERQKQLAQVNGELNALAQVEAEKCASARS